MKLTNNDKIIFLDVDGVLNSEEFFDTYRNGQYYSYTSQLDKRAIARLKKIIDRTGAKVVVSSAWRLGWLDELYEQINPVGIYPIDTTAMNRSYYISRAKEIDEWLSRHPEIDKYVVLDDLSMELPNIRSHHVHTNPVKGLEDWHVDLAEKILNGELVK